MYLIKSQTWKLSSWISFNGSFDEFQITPLHYKNLCLNILVCLVEYEGLVVQFEKLSNLEQISGSDDEAWGANDLPKLKTSYIELLTSSDLYKKILAFLTNPLFKGQALTLLRAIVTYCEEEFLHEFIKDKVVKDYFTGVADSKNQQEIREFILLITAILQKLKCRDTVSEFIHQQLVPLNLTRFLVDILECKSRGTLPFYEFSLTLI